MEGLFKIKPNIKKIEFPYKGKMAIHLDDGRIVIVPLRYFPGIRALNMKKRSKWYVLDGEMFSFDDCNEVYHIEQVFGKEQDYKYHFA
jgi:hypothetical protein